MGPVSRIIIHLIFAPALNYPEAAAPIRRGHYRVNRLRCERRVEKLANRPNVIGNADGDARRGPQGFVNAAEVEVRRVG
jgi:hypothetical protein